MPIRATGKLSSVLRLMRRGRWSELRTTLLGSAVLRRFVYYDSVLIVRRTGTVPMRHSLDRIQVSVVRAEGEQTLRRLSPRRTGTGESFDAGHICLLATIADQPVACNWYDLSGAHASKGHHYRVELPPGSCWAYGFVVHPEHRLSGAFVKLWSEGFRILSERGVSAVYGTIQSSNQRSFESHRRLGFEPVVHLSVWGIVGIPFYRASWIDGPVESGFGAWEGKIHATAKATQTDPEGG